MKVCWILIILWMVFGTFFAGNTIDYDKLELSELIALANKNDPAAMRTYARKWYLPWKDYPKYQKLGWDLITEAANLGDLESQLMLRKKYEDSKEWAEAFKWVKMAAEKGHAESQLRLADMYYGAIGVKQNRLEALKWYKLFAEKVTPMPRRR